MKRHLLLLFVASVFLLAVFALSTNAAIAECYREGANVCKHKTTEGKIEPDYECRPADKDGMWCYCGDNPTHPDCAGRQNYKTAAPAQTPPSTPSTIDYTGRPTCTSSGVTDYAGEAWGQCGGGLKGNIYPNTDVVAANCGADGEYHAVLHYKNLKPCGTGNDPGGLVHKCANGVDASDKSKNYWTQRGKTAGLEGKDSNCVYAVTCNVDGSYSVSAKALQCDTGKTETTQQPAATQCAACASFPSTPTGGNYCYTVRCSSSGCTPQQVACPGSSISSTATASCTIGGSGAATATGAAASLPCSSAADVGKWGCKDSFYKEVCTRTSDDLGDKYILKEYRCSEGCDRQNNVC